MTDEFTAGTKVRGEWHGDGDNVLIAEGEVLGWEEVFGLPRNVGFLFEAVKMTKVIETNVTLEDDYAIFFHDELTIIE